MDIELLGVVGRDTVEGLAHVDPHVGAVDVGDVENGRGNKAGCNNMSWITACNLDWPA